MSYKLSEEFKEKAGHICARYPRRDAALIPLLHELQRENGFVAEEAMDELAQFLKLPYSRVKAVTTFYTMFNREPAGKYHIQVCRGTACHVLGSLTVLQEIEKQLKLKAGQSIMGNCEVFDQFGAATSIGSLTSTDDEISITTQTVKYHQRL